MVFNKFEDGLLDLIGGADFVSFENDVLFVLGIMVECRGADVGWGHTCVFEEVGVAHVSAFRL